MKSKHLLLLLLLAALAPRAAWSQTLIEINGTEQANIYDLPFYTPNNYSLSEQIYTSAELGDIDRCLIRSIEFFNRSTYTFSRSNVDIYIVHTDKDHFELQTAGYSNDAIKVTSADRVFHGEVNFSNSWGWNTITFTTPFCYRGHRNICIVVDDNTGSSSTAILFQGFKTSDVQALSKRGTENYDPTTIVGGDPRRIKNYIRLQTEPLKNHIAATASDTQMTWDEFAQNVNSGITYHGMTVFLDDDITTSTIAGTSSTNCFRGIFNGKGHTLTFNRTATEEEWTAPFRYLNEATIRDLKVDGTITTSFHRCAGLAGACFGNNTITNCLSDITINSSFSGDGSHGGFISFVSGGTTTIEGCAFTGRLLGGNTISCGGFIGWNDASVTFNNCVFAPTQITIQNVHSATFGRRYAGASSVFNINNCYYTYNFNDGTNHVSQGKLRYTVTAESPVTVAMVGTPTFYMSHITTYSDNAGLLYNGTIIAGSGDQLSLNLSGGDYGYLIDHGTLTGTTNPYTLTMAAYNTVISPIKNHIASNSSSTAMTWDEFATNVDNGITYNGITVYLDEDIATSTMVGASSNLFQGTFDGQGHTITFTKGTSSSRFDEEFCALFRRISSATIKNLKVTGAIYTSQKFAGGIVGGVFSHNGFHFINCESNIILNSSVYGDGTHGGIVGYVASTSSGSSSFEGCAFTGSLIGSITNSYGGFVGYSDASVNINNCVFAPEQVNIRTENSCTFARGSDVTVTNCYYTRTLGTAQGKLQYTVTVESPATVTMDGTVTNYDMSHITAYNDNAGLLYNGTIIASSGDQLSLNLGGGDSYSVNHGLLTGTANPYTLSMTASSTIINVMIDPIDLPTLPYSTDFETDGGWEFINGECVNRWYWGTAAHNGEGSHGLYISNDGGISNAYDYTFNYGYQGNAVYAYKTFNFEAGTYKFSYDWRAKGESNFDFLRVVLVPNTVRLEAGTTLPEGLTFNAMPEGWLALDGGSYLSNVDEWQSEIHEIEIATAGNYKMVFVWRNDRIYGTNPPAAIDNVSIDIVTCLIPADLTVSNIAPTTADLSWTGGPEAESYTVKYRRLSESEWQTFIVASNATEMSTTLSGLSPETQYEAYVYPDCDPDKVSETVSFTTLESSFPYSTDFETACDWTLVNGSRPNQWCWGTAAHNGEGTHGLYISNDGGTTNAYEYETNSSSYPGTVVYAYKTFNFDAGQYEISYDWRANGWDYADYLRVALVPEAYVLEAGRTTPNGLSYNSLPNDWIALDGGLRLNGSTEWQTVNRVIEMPSGTYKMAFIWVNYISYMPANPPAAIDNVTIESADCPLPDNLAASHISAHAARINWDVIMATDSYTLKYRTPNIALNENFENGIGDWTLRDCGSGTQINANTLGGAHSGISWFVFSTSTTTPQYLISPELTGIGQGMRLDFHYSAVGPDTQYFQVGFSSTDNATESFTFGETITTTDYQWHHLALAVPAGTKYICWKFTPNVQYGLKLDDIMVKMDASAGEWLATTVADNDLQVSVTLTGLTPETQYEAMVYPNCNPDKLSDVLNFTTMEPCPTPTELTASNATSNSVDLSWTGDVDVESYTLKYKTTSDLFTESFEYGIGDWTLRNCGINTMIRQNAHHSGDAAFCFSNSNNPPQYLISPELTDGAKGMKLEFYYQNHSQNKSEKFQIGFSTTDNATESFTFGDTITASGTEWHRYYETIPVGTKYICWKVQSNNQDNFYIDDIWVGKEVPASEWQTTTVAGGTDVVSTTLTGLRHLTIYDAFVYPDCNPDKASNTIKFVTGEANTVTQTIELSKGWNWVSTYIAADDPVELCDMFKAGLGENGLQIQASNGAVTEFDGEEWFGDLDEEGIFNEQAYLIQTSAACTILLEGPPTVVDEYEITINPGWNWIGFPSAEPIDIIDALSNFEAEEGDQIQCNDATSTEFDGEEWFGDLETFTPGQGYMYYSNSEGTKTLIFSTGAKTKGKTR